MDGMSAFDRTPRPSSVSLIHDNQFLPCEAPATKSGPLNETVDRLLDRVEGLCQRLVVPDQVPIHESGDRPGPPSVGISSAVLLQTQRINVAIGKLEYCLKEVEELHHRLGQ